MNTYGLRLSVTVLALLLSAAAAAEDVAVKDAWVRGTVRGQSATGAFMTLVSSDGAVLVAASSPVASVVELHRMVMEGNVMKMRAVPRLELPAGQRVELKPGGYHIMLMDLKQPLTIGETVPLTLTVEGLDKKLHTIDVMAEVRALSASGQSVKH